MMSYKMQKGRTLLALSLLTMMAFTSCTLKLPLPSTNKSSNSSNSSSPSSGHGGFSPSFSSSDSSVVPPDPDIYQVIETPSKRMPAEFEPQSQIIMCYPNNMPLSVYKTIADYNNVLVLVNPDSNGKSRVTDANLNLATAGVNMNHVTFRSIDIGDDYYYWARDFNPFFTFYDKDLAVVDFTYNRPRYAQNNVPSALANDFNMPYAKMDLTHTGGNLMQDGRGTAFSDDLVVSENNNNASKVRTQMQQYTGTDNYVITIDPQGDYIAHIDCWAKIVAPDKIIVARLPKTNSRYQYYEQVAAQLGNLKCAYGYNYRIYRVDEPGGNTIAPYTNSLIANKRVFMPLGENETYNQNALNVYQEALPGYQIIGVEGFSFNQELCFLNTDALHCRTHEIPDDDMIFIDSREVYRGTVPLQEEYLIKTNIVSYANETIYDWDVNIHYSINGGEFITAGMSRYEDTTNYTYTFEGLQSGDDVKYYIDARDSALNYNIDPTCGSLDPHHFTVA